MMNSIFGFVYCCGKMVDWRQRSGGVVTRRQVVWHIWRCGGTYGAVWRQHCATAAFERAKTVTDLGAIE